MIRPPRSLRTVLIALAAALAAALALRLSSPAHAQQMVDGMDRVALEAQTPEERRIFLTLLCMCGGCKREDIANCTCSYARDYRDQVRVMIAKGMSLEQIHAEWVKRYGSESLSVPPNVGANRLLYVVPLVAIVAMAVFVGLVLRRFQQRGQKAAAGDKDDAPPGEDKTPNRKPDGTTKRDAYDEKLDDELRQLDDDS